MNIWQRALIGLFLGLYYHDYRLTYYPEIINRLEAAREARKLEKNIEAIVIQFLKALETEKVTKKIREEILPEMMKMKSTLEEKLDPDKFLRINRSTIVNVEKIDQLKETKNNNYCVVLDNKRVFPWGRRYREKLVKLIKL